MSPNNSNGNSGAKESFCGLFDSIQQVEIPVIQRDYAQGREKVKEIRDNFLSTLYEYLDQDDERDLDFIYGIMSDNGEKFIPLDGQQRLTTLFLLAWFLYIISDDPAARKRFQQIFMKTTGAMVRAPLTYATRESSRDFCDGLINSNIAFDPETKISEIIKNEPWFYRYWQKDPTIRSMLNMLDAIQEKFAGKGDFLASLLQNVKPVINFTFMDLGKFNLTDDIYIKMNSRDKPLTDFENFKASLIKYAKDSCQDCQKFKLPFGKVEKDVDFDKYLSHQFDTSWTDLLWRYCLPDKQKKLDAYYENLIWVLITSNAIQTRNGAATPVKIPDDIKKFQDFIRPDVKRKLTFYNYKNADMLACGTLIDMANNFDKLAANLPLDKIVPDEYRYYFPVDLIFDKILENKSTYPDRLQFYAFVSYLTKYGVVGIGPWLRVIHNLSDGNNTPTESVQNFVRGIQSIYGLLPYASSINGYLAAGGAIEYFSSWQTNEEIIKAILINKEDAWRCEILSAEKRPWFDGQIALILQLAGIYEYYQKEGHLNWGIQENQHYLQNFKNYSHKAAAIFPDQSTSAWKYCFERAVLTKGDYLPQDYAGHKNLLSSRSRENNIPRDWSWRRWLRLEDSNSARIDLIKKVLDDPNFNVANAPQSLEIICKTSSQITDWRLPLIIQPDIFDYCKLGFIDFNYPIMLLSKRYMGSYHVQLYSYAFFLKDLATTNWDPLKIKNIPVYGADTQPCIRFEMRLKTATFYLDIIAEMNKYNFVWFLFTFYDELRNPVADKSVIAILTKLGFISNNYKYEAKSNNTSLAKTLILSFHAEWLKLP